MCENPLDMSRIWIDTDVGTNADDAFCLGLAARDTRVILTGVSTVYGDTQLRSRITKQLLELAGYSKPVITGIGHPLSPDANAVMSGTEGEGLIANRGPVDVDYPGALDKTAMGDLAVEATWTLAIGPLTNVATAFDYGVGPRRLSTVGGPNDDGPEWNWGADPLAVQRVFGSGTEIWVYPWSITSQVVLSDAQFSRLDRSSDSLCRVLADQMRRWLRVRPTLGKPPPHLAYLHDPVTLVALVEPDLIEHEPARLSIDADGSAREVSGEPNCMIARSINAAAVGDFIVDTLIAGRS